MGLDEVTLEQGEPLIQYDWSLECHVKRHMQREDDMKTQEENQLQKTPKTAGKSQKLGERHGTDFCPEAL